MAVVRTEDLVRRFGPITAVDGVSFEVNEGEVFGFLGPNGAGKTTTISILCTLLNPTEGRAWVAGHDVVTEREAVRSKIGIVFQDPSLDSYLTAWENMRFHGDVYGMSRSAAAPRIKELLELVDLYERRDAQAQTFSGGMRRRLEMARGLLHRPTVLFLDEPTIGLDPQTRQHLWEYVLQLGREENITIFLTTHYMEEAEHCHRIAIIDNGSIIALDTPEGLKRGIGGDALTLKTADDARASEILRTQLGLDPHPVTEGVHVAVPDGDAAIPRVLAALPVEVRSVKLTRPSLDDVFIEKTGRHIRDEEIDAASSMRSRMGAWARSGRSF